MTRRSVTLQRQTRLAVQIIIEDDTAILTYTLLLATRVFAHLYTLILGVSAVINGLLGLITDIKTALTFTGKVLSIGFNAVAYGFGITL